MESVLAKLSYLPSVEHYSSVPYRSESSDSGVAVAVFSMVVLQGWAGEEDDQEDQPLGFALHAG